MKQQIDELRDLNVVDRDLGFVLTCDDQVLLLGPIQFQTPCGYTVDATAGEVGARKVGAHQNGRSGGPPVEVRPAKVRLY